MHRLVRAAYGFAKMLHVIPGLLFDVRSRIVEILRFLRVSAESKEGNYVRNLRRSVLSDMGRLLRRVLGAVAS